MILALSHAQLLALRELRAARSDARIVLVGAAALASHLPLSRSTADIDLVIAVAPEDLDAFLAPLGWDRDPRMLQRWRGPEEVVADVIPVSDALLAAGEIRFGGGDFAMSLVGFDLVMRHTNIATSQVVDVAVEVATLPVLVILKMVAWLDRPYERIKDLADLGQILNDALAPDDVRRWDPEEPVFQAGLDHEDQSAFFIGAEVARVAGDQHREVVARFLERVEEPTGSAFGMMLRAVRYGGADPEERLERRLAAFRRGLDGR